MSDEQNNINAERWNYLMKTCTLPNGYLKLIIEGCTQKQFEKIIDVEIAKAEVAGVQGP